MDPRCFPSFPWSFLAVLLVMVGCSTLPDSPLPAEASPPAESPQPSINPVVETPADWKPDPDPTRYEGVVIDHENQYAPGTLPPKPIVFVGSSTITNWKALEGLWPAHRVLNRGFGGSSLSDLLYYFPRLVTANDPRQVFIYEGDNDTGAGKPVSQLQHQFRQLAQLTRDTLPGVPIVIIGVKLSENRWAVSPRVRELNQWLREFSQQQGWGFVDIAPVLLGPDGRPDPRLYEADRLHLNAAGYRKIQPLLEALLAAP